MNLALADWLQSLSVLAAEIALATGAAAAVAGHIKSASWRRTIWHAWTLCAILIVSFELAGPSRAFVANSFRTFRSGFLNARLLATTPTVRSDASRLAPVANVSPDAAIPPDEAQINRSIPILATQALATTPSLAHPGNQPQNQSTISKPVDNPGVQIAASGLILFAGIAWILGTAFVLAKAALSRLLLTLFRSVRTSPANHESIATVTRLARHLRFHRQIRVLEAQCLAAPMVFGFLKPTIVLPRGFSRCFTPLEREVMLSHEVAHIAGGDSFWYGLLDIVSAFLWWHPIVWLGRRMTHAATEAAADEASLLIEDGPRTLAECLVAVGGTLSAHRQVGWLGIGGFKSNLGRRVDHLIHLAPKSWQPSSRSATACAKLAGGFSLAFVLFFSMAWISPHAAQKENSMKNTWKQSLTTLALLANLQDTPAIAQADRGAPASPTAVPARAPAPPQAQPVPPAVDPATGLPVVPDAASPATETPATVVTKKKKRAAEAAVLGDVPQEQIESATQPQPQSQGLDPALARRYGLVPPAVVGGPGPAPARAVRAIPAPVNSTVSPQLARRYGLVMPVAPKAAQTTDREMDLIMFNEIMFDGIPLADVLKRLSEEIHKRYPDQKGPNFLINPNSSQSDNATTTAVPPETPQTGDAIIKFNLPLQNLTLRNLLAAIVKVSDRPIRYSIEDYAIVFSSGRDPIPDAPASFLPGRSFKINPTTFIKGLERAFGIPVPATAAAPSASADEIEQLTKRKLELELTIANLKTKYKDAHPVIVDAQEKLKVTLAELAARDTSTNTPTALIQEATKKLMNQLGVNMGNPGRSVIYNEYTGIVLVRATAAELDVIQAAMETLGSNRTTAGSVMDRAAR